MCIRDRFRPYLTYVDTDGRVQDTMFDTVLLLGIVSRYGRLFNHVWGDPNEKARAKDWEWYIDKTFREGGEVDNLNKAAKRASEELGDPNYKVKLVVMFPSIDKLVTDFGSLDGSHSLDFSETEDYQYAADWWIDQVVSRMESGKYEYVELEGLYEMDEQIDFRDSLQYVADKVHSYGYKYYWIPHYLSLIHILFDSMPLGKLFGFLFFVLVFFAAATSAISLLEVVVSFLIDTFHWSRIKAAVSMSALMGAIGVVASRCV